MDEKGGIEGEENRRRTGSISPNTPRFTLNSPIEAKGYNLSTGDSKILILHEATTSVDYEADRKI